MNKIFVIARREYHTTIRTKSFVVALVLMPVFMLGSVAVKKATQGRLDVDVKRVAVVDRTGRLLEPIQQAAQFRNSSKDRHGALDDSGRQIRPKFDFLAYTPKAVDRDAQLLELSDLVRDQQYFAFIEIGADTLQNGGKGDNRVHYYSNQPTYDDISDWLEYVLNDLVSENRLAAAGLDKNVVMHALSPIPLDNFSLLTRGPDGKVISAKPVDRLSTFMIPFGMLMLMWITITMTTQPMLTGIIDEKMQRISEVLLGSVNPFQLMFGKLIGFVGVAVTLVGIYLLGGYLLARYYGYGDLVPFHLMGWFMLFQCVAIIMYGSLYLAVGSCCSDFREAQNLMMPILFVLMIPLFTLQQILQLPNSTFSTVISLFPPATPMIMMVRIALPPGPPLWEPIAGIIGSLLMTLLCVWAAGRIFRTGLLLQGKAPKMSELVRWVFQG